MNTKVSVIICTHNPRADYLQRTLEALQSQSLSKSEWELILIDNASKEPLSGRWDLSWHPNHRIIREEQLGLTPARLRGIQEAKAELLCFVDDDNLLEGDYLKECLSISHEWPILGAWGGQQIPEFENGAPNEGWKIKFFTSTFGRDLWSNNYDLETAPIGAGVCIRRSIASEYLKKVRCNNIRSLLDRAGEQLLSGGDIDMDYVACDLGFGTGKFVKLKLTHLIPERRTTTAYIVKLCEGFGYTDVLFKYIRGKNPVPPSLSERVYQWYCFLRTEKGPKKNMAMARNGGELKAFTFLKKIHSR